MRPLKRIIEFIRDPAVDFRERLFALLTTIAEVVLALVCIGDIILGEDIREIIGIGATVLIIPVMALLCLKYHKPQVGGMIVAVAGSCIVLPVTFFFGGGLYGGSVIWFSFAYLFLGLLLTGKLRMVMMILISLIAVGEYYIGYFHPELIVPHSTEMFFLDSLVSVLLVGIVVFIIVWFQNRMYISENKRVEDQSRRIEEMSRSQSRFFSNMSHEIRTPINTIIGLNEMILREDISEEVTEDAVNIRSASKMLLHLINDILDMSKLESGQMELAPVNYKPGDMLSELVGMLWIRAKEKNLDFRVSVAPDLPSVLLGDEVRIKQVLINVLNNAIKYTKEGSVTLSIQCGKREHNIQNVIYTVTDTGIGIKKENIPYLFNAYKRVDETTNRYIEGTGLGLSIVKQFTELMNGKITVNSVYTKGTTFIIEIPQKVIDEVSIGEVDFNQRRDLNGMLSHSHRFEAPSANVLVVDDNASNLLVVTKLLRETKVKTDTAQSGAEALRKTLNKHYHVIYMDHLMPEMDGLECRRAIKSQVGGQCRNSKIIALTANAGSESQLLYEKEGFDGYLVKPISGEELESNLCRALPNDLVLMSGDDDEIFEESISWMHSDQKKKNIVVTTESVADLPQELIDRYGIQILPHRVCTDEGEFMDGLEVDSQGILGYMKDSTRYVRPRSPDVKEHEDFFAKQLSYANNIIHISISSKVTESGCPAALEAAAAFDNVTVVDTGHLSSGQGLMVIEACRLAEEGRSPAEIVEHLNRIKKKVHTSFIVDDLDFLARANQISRTAANLTRSFMIRPVLVLKNGKMTLGHLYLGSQEHARRKYIDRVLKRSSTIDTRMLFITHAGLTNRELEKIKERVNKKMTFDKIYFQKASPAISVNCGSGTFGLLLQEKL